EKYEKYARPGESEGYAGSGLGLYICKKIVSSHNGALSVQSMNNQGATFIVRLPKAGCRSQGPLA
ncbi:MAG: ATP-binding protein, partial [Cyanobacteriota/Melainabacteria group bacterium]